MNRRNKRDRKRGCGVWNQTVKRRSLKPQVKVKSRHRHARVKMARKERCNETISEKEANQDAPRKRERSIRVRARAVMSKVATLAHPDN